MNKCRFVPICDAFPSGKATDCEFCQPFKDMGGCWWMAAVSSDEAQCGNEAAQQNAMDAQNKSPNSAMVPCPYFKNERTCPIQFNAICGLNPCLIRRAQHHS
jgi:hypothetical protein